MTEGGTAAYDRATDLSEMVRRAVALAHHLNFDFSCRPEQGRLLSLLAAGRRGGTVGETGTGCGVGLAWLLDGAGPHTPIFSVEADKRRAEATADLFADSPNVTIIHADWPAILLHAPFDLLVVDGGGSGKTPGDSAIDPRSALQPFGTIVIDDFTPLISWPPRHEGRPDQPRLHWLEHADLLATEVVVCPEMSTIVAVRRD